MTPTRPREQFEVHDRQLLDKARDLLDDAGSPGTMAQLVIAAVGKKTRSGAANAASSCWKAGWAS